MSRATYNAYSFTRVKANKNSAVYSLVDLNDNETFMTDIVRVEKFMGFSKAYNLDEYFRVRDKSNWKLCRQISGLWKTNYPNVFFGDFRHANGQTLILFKFSACRSFLKVLVYRYGFYPSAIEIDAEIEKHCSGF